MALDLHRRFSYRCPLDMVCRFLILACLAATARSFDPASRFDPRLAHLLRNPFSDRTKMAPMNSNEELYGGGIQTTTKAPAPPMDPGLSAVFNHRVQSPSQLCPKQYTLLYLITKDVKYLKDCGNFLGISNKNTTSYSSKVVTPTAQPTYSGKLLKRILQNMDSGSINPNLIKPRLTAATKRARLSVNSALSSLADMLRHESSGHREPVYAFHREMLKMG